jgi:transcriptional regulator with XRE-family HTH domain
MLLIGERMPSSLWSTRNRAIVTVLTASRREAGLTQRQLAERLPEWLGWDHSTVGKVESGRRRLDVVELLEIARALRIDSEVLFGRIAHWR